MPRLRPLLAGIALVVLACLGTGAAAAAPGAPCARGAGFVASGSAGKAATRPRRGPSPPSDLLSGHSTFPARERTPGA